MLREKRPHGVRRDDGCLTLTRAGASDFLRVNQHDTAETALGVERRRAGEAKRWGSFQPRLVSQPGLIELHGRSS